MLPFRLLSVSWPRPVQQVADRWTSEPEWDAPRAPHLPSLVWRANGTEWLLGIDWCEWFRSGMFRNERAEMRGFHVVFRLQMQIGGRLVFWDDDGSIIRRAGAVVHEDRRAHPRERHEIDVVAGDEIEVAQWQFLGEWYWGARVATTADDRDIRSVFSPYLSRVSQRIGEATGPTLKMFTHGREPARVLLAVYSLVLNGYVPRGIRLYGEHQWTAAAREVFLDLLPSVELIPTDRVVHQVVTVGGRRLAALAEQHWFVLKAVVALLDGPTEFCAIDDDVVILESLQKATAAFRTSNLVFTPERDLGPEYCRFWRRTLGATRALPTGRLNAGLYWMRNRFSPRSISEIALTARPDSARPHLWEQGLLALLGARDRNWTELPSAQFLFPGIDGLPATPYGYDFAGNPCGFTAVHFTGGSAWKPDQSFCFDRVASVLDGPRVRCKAGTSQGSPQ